MCNDMPNQLKVASNFQGPAIVGSNYSCNTIQATVTANPEGKGEKAELCKESFGPRTFLQVQEARRNYGAVRMETVGRKRESPCLVDSKVV